jgi:hypothetical protein
MLRGNEMNFKLKALVAAVVLSAAATSANAAITAASGNSELVFSAWDSVAGVGYTYDLNWNKFLNDMVGIDQAASTAGNALLTTNAVVQSSMIGAGGVIFDDVLTGLPFANASNVQWNLGAYDSGTGRTRLLITQGDSGLPFTSTNDGVKTAATLFGTYAPAANGFIVPPPVDDTYAVTSSTNGAAYAGNTGDGFNGKTVDTTNVLGGSSFMYLLAPTTLSASAATAINQQLFSFDGNAIVAKTYLDTNNVWRLNISAAPVPETDTSAMMIAGLGLMGFIARRRRNSLTK